MLAESDTALFEVSRPCTVSYEPLDDVFWARMLVARHFDVRQAVALAESYLSWRRSTNGGMICPLKHFDGKLFPLSCISRDGFPLAVFRTRFHDATSAADSNVQGFRGLMDANIARHLLERKKAGSSVPVNAMEQYICIIDLQGFSRANFDMPTIKAIVKDTDIYYPELLSTVIMVNVPGFFKFFWTLIAQVLDPRTVKKYVFLGKNDLGELKNFMHDSDIPESLGGSGQEWALPADMTLEQRLGIFSAVLQGAD